MALNFNLLRREGPSNIVEGLMQGQEQARLNALAQEKAAQDREMNALRQRQLTGQIAEQEDTRRKQARVEKTAMFRERLLRAPNAQAAREIVKMQYADPDLGSVLSQAGTLEQALMEVPDDPTKFETYRQQEAMGMDAWMKSQMPKVVGNAVYLPGEQRFMTAPSQRLESVISPSGVPMRVPADQAVGMVPLTAATAKMAGIGAAPARAADGATAAASTISPNLTPKEIQKREASLPQARQAVTTVANTMAVIEETVDRLLANEAGLNGVTGLIGGRTPGITDAARKAEADLSQLKNLAFVQGITELRNASKTGAGVGNVSNKEGERFENLKAALDRTQSLQDMKDSLGRLKTQAGFTKQTIQDAFDETYAYRDQNAAPPKPPGANIEQERANAKAAIAAGAPAAAVRARFKEKTGQEL